MRVRLVTRLPYPAAGMLPAQPPFSTSELRIKYSLRCGTLTVASNQDNGREQPGHPPLEIQVQAIYGSTHGQEQMPSSMNAFWTEVENYKLTVRCQSLR